jgi:fucose 4-O-acetylase-like acetyltransferase
MAVGRLALDRRPVALRVTLTGIALAVGATVLSAVLASWAGDQLPAGAADQLMSGTTPATTAWWLVTAEPHSATPLDLAATIGSALALLGLMLLLEPLLGRALLPLAWLGSMTLTLYTLHTFALADGVGPSDPELLWGVHAVAALVLTTAVRRTNARGPVEHLVSWLSHAAAARVAAPSSR